MTDQEKLERMQQMTVKIDKAIIAAAKSMYSGTSRIRFSGDEWLIVNAEGVTL